MLDIIENHKYETDRNEDIYFCKHLDKYGKLAPRNTCGKFAVETVFKLGAMGFHAIDVWLTKAQCKQILKQYDHKNNQRTGKKANR